MILRELINLIKFKVDEASLRNAEKRLNTVIGGLDQFGRKATLMVTTPFVALSALSVKAASDAIETQNKFNQVFGELAGEATKFSEEYSKSVGRFKVDTQNGLAAIQSMAVGLGYANDVSFGLSKRVQRLIIDFGSFHNLQDEESQRRFMSALAGSAQVMDMYGVNLKQAAIDQELLAMGIQKSAAKASEAEKFLARINIIEKTMTRQGAVGDAIRTLGEFANKSRSAFSRVRAVAVGFGARIIPYLNRLLDVGIGLLDWVDNLSDSAKEFIIILGGLAAAIGPLTLGLAGLLAIVKSLMLFSTFMGGLAGIKSTMLLALQPQFLLIAGAILVAVAALALFIQDVMTWVQGGDSLVGKLLGPWEKWAAGLKEMFSLMLEDFGTFVKALGIAVLEGLQQLSDDLEKTTFGKLVKWVSLIKPAEILGEFAGTALTNLQRLSPSSFNKGSALENAAFAAYNQRVRNSTVNVNSTIEMQVPQGTKDEQVAAITDAAERAVKETFSKQLTRLYDNEVSDD